MEEEIWSWDGYRSVAVVNVLNMVNTEAEKGRVSIIKSNNCSSLHNSSHINKSLFQSYDVIASDDTVTSA